LRSYLRSNLCSLAALSGLVACPAAIAAEYPIDITTDIKAKFFVVEKAGTANNPTRVVKRVGGSRAIYTKRLFDCKAHTVKYLGEGASLDEMNKPLPDQKMTPIVDGSIPDQLARHVCPK